MASSAATSSSGGRSMLTTAAFCALLLTAAPLHATAFTVGPKSGNSIPNQLTADAAIVPNAVADLRLGAATAVTFDSLVVDNDSATHPETSEAEETKVGVLLLNLGGPETGEDVEGTFVFLGRR